MSDESAVPPHVAELFLELNEVLEEARSRLQTLVRDAIPAQATGTHSAGPSAATP